MCSSMALAMCSRVVLVLIYDSTYFLCTLYIRLYSRHVPVVVCADWFDWCDLVCLSFPPALCVCSCTYTIYVFVVFVLEMYQGQLSSPPLLSLPCV